MSVSLISGLLLSALSLPALSADWTTSYASLSRTSYLASEAVVPPFALQWEYESPKPLKGAPIVALNRAYVNDEQLHVWSLNLTDGTVAWKHDEVRSPSDVKCYDALTGRQRWIQTVDGNIIHTPQIGQQVVYVSSSSGILYAFNQMDGELLWKTAIGTPLTLPAADASLVLVGSGNSLCGINPIDGKEIFKTDIASPVTGVPVVSPEGGYVAVSDAVVALDRVGHERWRVKLKSPAWASLAVTNDGVLVGCVDSSIKLLARETGAMKWEVLLAGTPNVLAGAGSAVYVGTRQGTLVGMKLADGSKLWSAALGHGPVDGVALSAGKLVVVAGKWVGALLPAPEPPDNLAVHSSGNQAELSWTAPATNGSPISAYRVFRRRGANDSQVAVVPANTKIFSQETLPGGIGYSLVAVAANGAESARSTEVNLAKGEPLIKRLVVSPAPYDPRTGSLVVSFQLRDGAKVTWSVLDAESGLVTDEQTSVLPRGDCIINWSGNDRMGKPVEPGVYKVSLWAVADKEDELSAKAFPVVYGFDGGSGGLAGSNQDTLHPAGRGAGGSAGGSFSGNGTGGSSANGSSSGASDGGNDASSDGKRNNGVRDRGIGEGRDGAGQGKGQGQKRY
jgi:outer membrane protein assembly factor BamB